MKNVSIYRANAFLLFIILSVIVLYFGRQFLIPLFFAIGLSMLMLPVSRWLESKGIGRIGATFLCLLIFLLFIAAIILVITLQASKLSQDLPLIQLKLQQSLNQLQLWIEHQFGVAPRQQVEFVKEQVATISESANLFFTSVVGGTFSLLAGFTLVVLYFFFLMWKREKYQAFFLKLFHEQHKDITLHTLRQISNVSAQYLLGRLISMLFLGICYSIGFSIIGLKDAVLIGIIAVLPTIIPYVGAFVGGAFPVLMAFVSPVPGIIIPVIVILVVAQILDNNIIEPLVMSARLHISPIMTIIAIVLGERLWGIAGMILFEPMFAIIKIVCTQVPKLHPYGFLMDDDVGKIEWLKKLQHMFRRKRT